MVTLEIQLGSPYHWNWKTNGALARVSVPGEIGDEISGFRGIGRRRLDRHRSGAKRAAARPGFVARRSVEDADTAARQSAGRCLVVGRVG